jgi:hypothetical protein
MPVKGSSKPRKSGKAEGDKARKRKTKAQKRKIKQGIT